MKYLKGFVLYWFPALLWMFSIFYFSSRSRLGITETYLYDFIIFKTLHMIEYAFLYFLLFRAFFQTTSYSKKEKLLLPLVIGLLYAIIDEIHQTSVPTREGKLRDIMIDAFGITLMFLLVKKNLTIIRKYL